MNVKFVLIKASVFNKKLLQKKKKNADSPSFFKRNIVKHVYSKMKS